MKQQLLARLSRVRRSTLVMLLAGPVLAFYLSQFILGGWPWQYGLSLVLANSVCYGALQGTDALPAFKASKINSAKVIPVLWIDKSLPDLLS